MWCMVEKAYRYRFYPTPEQENLLRRTLGCVRLVYNKALAARTEGWYQRKERISYKQTSSMLTVWKKLEELDFLNDVSCVPLRAVIKTLTNGFYQLFSGSGKIPQLQKEVLGGECWIYKVGIQIQGRSCLFSQVLWTSTHSVESSTSQGMHPFNHYSQLSCKW